MGAVNRRSVAGFLVLLALSVALQFLTRRYLGGVGHLARLVIESVVFGGVFAATYAFRYVVFDVA